jgi:hypothetical protein
MDYCYACHRTLNGALVCPGCGAYAPDIAPPGNSLHNTVASAATTQEVWPTEEGLAPGSFGAAPVGGVAFDDPMGDASNADAPGDVEGTARTGQGRAARRRQLARWKKHRRRAMAATAFALVGGGLTVAAMPSTRPSTSHAHAAPPAEPVTAPATPKAAPAASQEQLDDAVSQQLSTGDRTTGREENTAVAVPSASTPSASTPSASTTSRQSKTVATAEPSVPRGATPHTAPVSSTKTDAGSADAPAAEKTTPTPTEERPTGTDTSLLGLVPTTPLTNPASPTQVCLIGVCLG